MKKHLFALLLGCSMASLYGQALEASSHQSVEVLQQAAHGQIDADGLRALMNSHTSFVLLDARGSRWRDNSAIPGASLVSYETSPEELAEIIPQADSLIVVYCYSSVCSLGRMMVAHLIENGYTNVLEYAPGLSEWRDTLHYPVVEIETN